MRDRSNAVREWSNNFGHFQTPAHCCAIGHTLCTIVIGPVDGRWEVVVSRSMLLLACVLVAANASAQALQTTTETAHNGSAATSTAAAALTTPTTTFRSSVDIVALNVVVTDSDQKYVAGLNPSDFAVFEDGIQQDVSFFGASDVPIDLAILLDTSASMTGKMHLVQQAAIGFLATLRPVDRATIVDIKDAPRSCSRSGAISKPQRRPSCPPHRVAAPRSTTARISR
jgi:hypothetical protein